MRITYKDENGIYQLDDNYVSEKGIDINGLDDITDYIGEREDLEDYLGCPLDVILKALRDGVYYTYYKSLFSRLKFQKLKVRLEYKYKGYVLTPIHKANFSLCLEGYKINWFLKEDRSE